MKKRRKKRNEIDMIALIIRGISNAAVVVLIILSLSMFLLRFTGIQPYVVMSGSMEPEIHTGSLCFVNTMKKYEQVKEGEIVAFYNTAGTAVTHRAIKITEEGMETKGDNNQISDGITVTKGNYIGETVFYISKIGYLLYFMQRKTWRILVVTASLSCMWLNMIFHVKE